MFDHKHRLEFEDDDEHEDEHECGYRVREDLSADSQRFEDEEEYENE